MALQGGQRTIEHQLRQSRRARGDEVSIQHRHSARDIGRAQMAMHRRPMPQGLFLGRQYPQFHIEPRGRHVQRGVQHPVAAMDVLAVQIRPVEVEGAALAGFAAFRGWFWAWMPRTRASRPEGEISNRSPTRTEPL